MITVHYLHFVELDNIHSKFNTVLRRVGRLDYKIKDRGEFRNSSQNLNETGHPVFYEELDSQWDVSISKGKCRPMKRHSLEITRLIYKKKYVSGQNL